MCSTANGGLTTPTDPAMALLTGILTKSPLITVITSLGLALWMWMWIPAMHTFGVRAVVAWAFDQRGAGATRNDLREISHANRRHYRDHGRESDLHGAVCFTPWFSKIVILIEAAVLAWSVVLAAGMFFPYLRPQLYEKSPIAGKTVFGLADHDGGLASSDSLPLSSISGRCSSTRTRPATIRRK